jgi:carboxymethylenebutenolidase
MEEHVMRQLTWILVLAALAAAPVGAQDWAKAKLEKSTRHQEFVKVKHDGREVQCFVVYPEVKNKAAAVLVIHEIFGLSDWARLLADELAEAGYIAIAPDLLSGAGPKGGGTAELGGQSEVMRAIQSLPPEQVTADLNAAADYVKKLPACNGKLAVCGFCWGGGQSFRYATNNAQLKAAFVFYGPGPDKTEDVARIKAPVYGFYAGNDGRIGATLPATTELMKKEGKSYDPKTYDGAGHGFMRGGDDPGGREGDKKAREDSWKRMKELLKKL